MEDYGREVRCILLLIAGLFVSFLSYAETRRSLLMKKGSRSLMLKPLCTGWGARHQRKYSFSGAKSADKHGFYRDLPRLWMQPDGDADC